MGNCCFRSEQLILNSDGEGIVEKHVGDVHQSSAKNFFSRGPEITIVIISAEVTAQDVFQSGSDPYVVLNLPNGAKFTTGVVRNSICPVWNDTVVYQVADPGKDFEAIVQVYDHDRFAFDDVLGEAQIHFGAEEWDNPSHEKTADLMLEGQKVGSIRYEIDGETDPLPDFNNWTHVVSMTVKAAKGLPPRDDPYCEVKFGQTKSKTKFIWADGNPTWNETTYFFFDEERHSENRVLFNLFDYNRVSKSKFLAGGSVSMAKLREYAEDDQFTEENPLAIKLSNQRVDLDDDLGVFSDASAVSQGDDADNQYGMLLIKYDFIDADQILDQVYDYLLDHFDENKDGVLSKDELYSMLRVITSAGFSDGKFDSKIFDDFFRNFDKNRDGDEYTQEDLKNALFDPDFQKGGMLHPLIHASLTHSDPWKGLMKTENTIDGGAMAVNRTHINVVDRITGLQVQEKIPTYISLALRMAFNSKAGRTMGWAGSSLLNKLSERQGRAYDQPESVNEIPHFVDFHRIDMSEVAKEIGQFDNFNDFFSRGLKEGARDIFEQHDPSSAVSCADCRCLVFDNVLAATRYWIKGTQFTLANVFGPAWEGGLNEHFSDGAALVIARLSPQDYHRWHLPITGTCTKITPCGDLLYSVNPIVINQKVDVYSENKRVVCEFDTEDFGKVVMVAVAATMVGSYELLKGVGDHCIKGEEHGLFKFGGSTVLTFYEKGSIEFCDDLRNRSREPIETLVRVGNQIGRAIPPELRHTDVVLEKQSTVEETLAGNSI